MKNKRNKERKKKQIEDRKGEGDKPVAARIVRATLAAGQPLASSALAGYTPGGIPVNDGLVEGACAGIYRGRDKESY